MESEVPMGKFFAVRRDFYFVNKPLMSGAAAKADNQFPINQPLNAFGDYINQVFGFWFVFFIAVKLINRRFGDFAAATVEALL